MTDQEIDTVIANWHTLNKALRHLTEADVKHAINRELVGNKRKTILSRLHSRFCMLRQKRELSELVNVINAPKFMGIVAPELE